MEGRREIKTTEEALKLDGKKVTCKIEGNEVKDCVITVEDGDVYFCQNRKDGSDCKDKKGYMYSWVVRGHSTLLTAQSVTDVYLVEEDKYFYSDKIELKDSRLPEWWDGRPILVYYSDVSEEVAISDGRMRWLVKIAPGHEYAYSTADFPGGITDTSDVTDEGITPDRTTEWRYAVPVTKQEEITGHITINRNGSKSTTELTQDQLAALGITVK